MKNGEVALSEFGFILSKQNPNVVSVKVESAADLDRNKALLRDAAGQKPVFERKTKKKEREFGC